MLCAARPRAPCPELPGPASGRLPDSPRIDCYEHSPDRGRLAVRQWSPPYRSRLRLRRPLRRLLTLHANVRERRAHGLWHRRTRHPDPGRRPTTRASPPASSPTATTGSSSRTSSRSVSPTTCSPAPPPATTTRSSSDMFITLHDNGYIFKSTTNGAISPSNSHTLPDRYIEGICPICGYDGARGDQCDNCGNQLDPDRPDRPGLPDQRRDPGVRRDRALLSRPAGPGRRSSAAGSTSARRPLWRPNVLNFSQNLLEDIKPAGDDP